MKLKFLLPALLLSTSALAQQQGVGIHFGGYDFYGPQTSGNYFFADQYKYKYNNATQQFDTSIGKHLYWKPLVKFSYWFQLNKYIDFNLGLSLASIEYPNSEHDSDYINKYYHNTGSNIEKLLVELDARVNYNILPKADYIVSPYLFAGITGSFHDIYGGTDIPLGVGLNFNLTKNHDLFLNVESAYKIAATSHDQNHLQHTFGFVYWFKPGYHKPAPAAELAPEPVVLDTDNDGVPDSADACPTIPGLAKFDGCPDSDGDGISDKDDACPLVAGLAQFQGCPDTDGDGISDNKDKCPYVAGTAQYDGCPPPDRDHDGVMDSEDNCPDVAGPASNHGCPEIRKEIITQVEKAAKAIFFETGKSSIKKVSFASLDIVVNVMKNDPSLYADIEGHTDNVKPKTYTNMELSQSRAQAVVDYFVSHGISADRLTAHGYGDTQPIADNKTAPGRAQNRRTVIKLRNFK